MKNPPQSTVSQSGLTCIEICSGAGGLAIGLERAGFEALAHVEFDRHACETLRLNRPDWNVIRVRCFIATFVPLEFHSSLTCIEICSGAGGQAIGLERAGFEALAHVEFDRHACETLRLNRPDWNVVEGDVRDFSAKEFKGVDLLAGIVKGQILRVWRRYYPNSKSPISKSQTKRSKRSKRSTSEPFVLPRGSHSLRA